MSLTKQSQIFTVGKPSLPRRLVAGFSLCLLADLLFFGQTVEIGFGIFITTLAAVMLLLSPNKTNWRRHWAAMVGVVLSVLPSLVQLDELSGFIAISALCLCALITNLYVSAFDLKLAKVLFDFIRRWPFGFVTDMSAAVRPKKRKRSMPNLIKLAVAWLLPLSLSFVFLSLFSSSNPIIEEWLLNIQFKKLFDTIDLSRVIFWLFALALCWPFLRVKLKLKRSAHKKIFPESLVEIKEKKQAEAGP